MNDGLNKKQQMHVSLLWLKYEALIEDHNHYVNIQFLLLQYKIGVEIYNSAILD